MVPGKARRRAPRMPRTRSLRCECLEDRRLLAITVDTLVDEADGSITDGDISLRDAIAIAPAGDTIDFSTSLDGGTILLTMGELSITKSLAIDATDFVLAVSGTANGVISSVTPIGGTDYTVTIGGITGVGTLGLDLIDDDSIVNSSANPIGGPGAGNGNVVGDSYTVDRIPPVVQSIVRADPDPTNAESVQFTVVFNEDVLGIDTTDLFLTTTGGSNGIISAVTPQSGSVYSVTVAGITGAGTLELDLVDDDSIIDSVSNPLGGTGTGNGDFAGEAYTVDRVNPSVESIVRANANPTNSENVAFVVSFSEAVTGVDLGDFVLVRGDSAVATIGSVTPVNGSTYTVSITGIRGTGTLGLDLADNDSIVDSLSNPLGGPGLGNGDFTGETYTVNSSPAPVPSIAAPF